MDNPNQADTEVRLHKLGQKVREGWEKRHPAEDRDLAFFKDAIREQWEKEQIADRDRKPAPDAAKPLERQAPEPDQGR